MLHETLLGEDPLQVYYINNSNLLMFTQFEVCKFVETVYFFNYLNQTQMYLISVVLTTTVINRYGTT